MYQVRACVDSTSLSLGCVVLHHIVSVDAGSFLVAR